MDIQEVTQWLIDQKYLYRTKQGGFLLTTLFHTDLKNGVKKTIFTDPVIPAVVPSNAVAVQVSPLPEMYAKYKYTDWVKMYQDFIIACKVPNRLESSNNNTYSANKFSEDGMKAFMKALKEGCSYNVLVAAVKLYYLSGIRWKKAIGTYMTSGEWRSDYQELYEKAEQGIEEVQKHVNDKTDKSSGTNYQFG